MRFYFLLDPNELSYCSIVIAQGLKKQDYEFSANLNHWKQEDGYLFKKSEVKSEDIIVSETDTNNILSWRALDRILPYTTKHFTVLIDVSDGIETPALDKKASRVDAIFKQMNRFWKYPKNVISPWVYGIVEELLLIKPKCERLPKELKRPRNTHSTRLAAYSKHINLQKTVDSRNTPLFSEVKQINHDIDSRTHSTFAKNSQIVGHRFQHRYLENVAQSRAVCTVGGTFVLPKRYPLNCSILTKKQIWFVDTTYRSRVKEFNKKLGLVKSKTQVIIQWDSWRLWESWSLGAAVLNFDFEKYGCVFPVMPKPFIHYIPLDFTNGVKTQDVDIEEIANTGRLWALTHYSPEAQALRFVASITGRKFSS